MSKLEQIYQRFLEEVNRPEKRKKELTTLWHKLNDQEEQAREAFAKAEAKGLESDKLFDDYQKVIRERKLTEAKLEVEIEVNAEEVAEELRDAALEEYQRLQCFLANKETELRELQQPVLDALADIVQLRDDIQHTKDLLSKEVRHYTTLPPDFRMTYQKPFSEYLIDENMVETYRLSHKDSN